MKSVNFVSMERTRALFRNTPERAPMGSVSGGALSEIPGKGFMCRDFITKI